MYKIDNIHRRKCCNIPPGQQMVVRNQPKPVQQISKLWAPILFYFFYVVNLAESGTGVQILKYSFIFKWRRRDLTWPALLNFIIPHGYKIEFYILYDYM